MYSRVSTSFVLCKNIYSRHYIKKMTTINPTHNLPLSPFKMKSSVFSVVLNRQIWPRFLVFADFITCLPPEKPRDIVFIPSSLSASKDGGYRE